MGIENDLEEMYIAVRYHDICLRILETYVLAVMMWTPSAPLLGLLYLYGDSGKRECGVLDSAHLYSLVFNKYCLQLRAQNNGKTTA